MERATPGTPSLLRRFMGEERGAIMVLLAVLLPTLVGIAGFAIDAARAHIVQSRLSRALDMAGLAAGRVPRDERDAVARKYFAANFPSGSVGTRAVDLRVNLDDDRRIELTASVPMHAPLMALMRRAGGDGDARTLTIGASSVVRISAPSTEVVLVLDNTGAQFSRPNEHAIRKKDLLKIGTGEVIDTLFAYGTPQTDLWVGVVPFTTSVNIGASRTGWLTGYSAASFSPGTWNACVEERGGGLDLTDDPPSAGRWKPYLYPSGSGNKWPPIDEDQAAANGKNNGNGPNVGCGDPLTPMTSNPQTVRNGVDEIGLWHQTGIMQHVGMAWAWRMLSPRWQGLWGGTMNLDSLPRPYGKDNRKIAILFTDGDNHLHSNHYTSYGFPKDGRLGSSQNKAMEEELDRRFAKVCESMKTAGVEIYVVGFDVKKSDSRAMLQACATAGRYFDAKDADAVRTAVRDIARRVAPTSIARIAE